MPHPLSHPAAILPLKRYCPRWLNFPALIIGSLVPDLGYCYQLGDFSHSFFRGAFLFCLPVGLLLLWCFYASRAAICHLPRILPEVFRLALLPLCRKSLGSPIAIVPSLLLGIWSHLLLDSMTHSHGWVVAHAPVLQQIVPLTGKLELRWYDALYLGWTLFGIAWLAWACLQFMETAFKTRIANALAVRWAYMLPFIVVSFCIAVNGRGGDGLSGTGWWGAGAVLMAIGFIFVTALLCSASRLRSPEHEVDPSPSNVGARQPPVRTRYSKEK